MYIRRLPLESEIHKWIVYSVLCDRASSRVDTFSHVALSAEYVWSSSLPLPTESQSLSPSALGPRGSPERSIHVPPVIGDSERVGTS